MSDNKLTNPEKAILYSIPILFFIGSAFHFLYDLSGQNAFVGMFSAVNESVWEHSKMILLPVIAFWFLYYLIKGEKYNIDKNKWFIAALVSLVTAIISMPLLYYFYTNAFGVEILLVDILLLLVSLAIGQLVGLHFYKHSDGIDWRICVFLIILIVAIYIIFTFNPPQIPLFKDNSTGQYGISNP